MVGKIKAPSNSVPLKPRFYLCAILSFPFTPELNDENMRKSKLTGEALSIGGFCFDSFLRKEFTPNFNKYNSHLEASVYLFWLTLLYKEYCQIH